MPSTLSTHEQPQTGRETGPPPSSAGGRRGSVRWRRRRYLVDWRYQLPGILYATAAAVVIVVLVNVSANLLSTWFEKRIIETLPEMQGAFEKQTSPLFTAATYAASVLFVIGVFMVSLVRSHHVAGPVYNLCKNMREVEQGNYGARVHLRNRDQLQQVAVRFNAMVEAIQKRACKEADALKILADQIEVLKSEDAAREASRAVREIAAQKEQKTGRLESGATANTIAT